MKKIEYPKWIYLPDGKNIIVKDEHEHAKYPDACGPDGKKNSPAVKEKPVVKKKRTRRVKNGDSSNSNK